MGRQGLLPLSAVGCEGAVRVLSLSPHSEQAARLGPRTGPCVSAWLLLFLPDLYRRAMLALKMRQEQRKQQSAIVP